MRCRDRWLCWQLFSVVSAAGLSGCGGGGGSGDSSTLALSLSPNPLTVSVYPNENPKSLNFTGKVSGSTTVAEIFVLVTDSSTTFNVSTVVLQENSPTEYAVALSTESGLSIGDHTGSLEVKLCSDAHCDSVLTQSNLPYSVTVKSPSLSAFGPSPLLVSGIAGGFAQAVGTVAGVEPTQLFAQVSDPDGIFLSQLIPLSLVNDTEYSYQANLPVSAGASATLHSGTITVELCPDSDCATVYDTQTYPYSLQVLSVLAGQPGVAGHQDGSGTQALFAYPSGLATDSAGNVFVADEFNYSIRKITPGGIVSTAYSYSPTYGPISVAVDVAENIFFSDSSLTIDEVSPSAVVTELGTGANGIALDSDGTVYFVSTTGNQYSVFKIPAGSSPQPIAFDEGQGNLALDPSGNIYTVGGNITLVTPGGQVSPFASAPLPPVDSLLTYGFVDVIYDAASSSLLASTNEGGVYRVSLAGATTILFPNSAILPNGNLANIQTYIAVGSKGQFYADDPFGRIILQTMLQEPEP